MNQWFWIILALIAGSALPLQGGVNAKLGKAVLSPYHAALVSFSIGVITLFIYTLITRQSVSWSGLKQLPPQYWTGGILGAVYVTIVILTFPKLGPGLTFGLVVAGQMMMSLLLEHYGILVTQQQSFNMIRMLGAAFIVGGAMLLKQ